jgi:uncharacterized membrane protein
MKKRIRNRPYTHSIIFWTLVFITFITSKVIYYYSGDATAALCIFSFLSIIIILSYLSLKINKMRFAQFYKETANLIWNISTSITFTYGIYILVRYKVISESQENVSVDYIHIHPLLSYFILGLLIITSIIRASISISEAIEKTITFWKDKEPL